MKIEIFAPVNCEVKPIEQSTDKMFSDKLLGDGILIIPTNKSDAFKSPFLNSKISQIFDTKHATWFEIQEGINALVHCGLETVTLNGTPFNFLVETGQRVSNKDTIFEVNWDEIEKANLSKETPIVFEAENKEVKIAILKQNANQGEKIAEIEIVSKQNVVKKSTNEFQVKSFKGKYRLTAEQIFESIGKTGNYNNVYHCMTRFRTNIVDKTKVNLDKIKQLEIVKGVQYNGDELQIIIGGEVTKVVDEFKKYELIPNKQDEDLESKFVPKKSIPIHRRMLAGIMAIMGPTLPAIMGAGMFSALYAIFDQLGWVNTIVMTPGPGGIEIPTSIGLENLYLFDMWSALMLLLSKVILNGVGVLFLFNAVKYFKGNTMIAMAVGLVFVSRSFYYGPAFNTGMEGMLPPIQDFGFGDWIADLATGKKGFLLFLIGDYPIVVGGFEGQILTYLAAAALICFSDKWIKSWMPSVVDIVFRPVLVFIITFFGTWFIFGPIMGIIEYGLLEAFMAIGKIPGGIGVGLLAAFWQPLVITGVQGALVMPIVLQMTNGVSSSLLPAISIGAFAQLGAVIGIAIATKNYKLKEIAIGTVSGGIFGVTEPIIFGVTLPRIKSFMLGCFAAFFGGVFSGLTGVTSDQMAGMGIFSFLSYSGGGWEITCVIISWLIAIALAIVFVALFYKERVDEFSMIKKIESKIIKNSGEKDKQKLATLKQSIEDTFKNEFDKVKAFKGDYKKYANYVSLQTKYEMSLARIEEKETLAIQKMFKKLQKMSDKFNNLKDGKTVTDEQRKKFDELNNKYNNFNLDNEKQKLRSIANKHIIDNNEFIKELNVKKQTLLKDIENIIKTKYESEFSEELNNVAYNSINSVEIGFGIEDAKSIKIRK